MVRAWCLTRSNGRILGLGPNSLPQVFHTREQARQALARIRSMGYKNIQVCSTDELTSTAWGVAVDGKIIGNGITSIPLVFRTREQARGAVSFAESLGKSNATVVRFGSSL